MKVFVTAVAAASILLTGCGKDTKPAAAEAAATVQAASQNPDHVTIPADSPKLAQIQVDTVRTAEVPVDQVTSPGKIEANPNRMAHVMLPVAGRIVAVSIRIGERVQQGSTLLTIESPDIDAAISAYIQAQASVAQARSVTAKAQSDLDRERDLFDHNAVAQKDVINTEAILTQAKASLEQSHAAVEQAQRRLQILGVKPGEFGQRLAVRAPISGKILEMNVVPGEFRNDTSAPVMTIADLSTVWVTADVPESAIRFIKTGERLDIELTAYPGETFRGRVTQIADLVDPQTRTVKVRAEVPNGTGRFRPDMFARVSHTETTEQRPVVPAAAVIQDEGKSFVWREQGRGQFQRAPVELGSRAGDRIAVKQGVNAGDRVVTDGVMLLRAR